MLIKIAYAFVVIAFILPKSFHSLAKSLEQGVDFEQLGGMCVGSLTHPRFMYMCIL